jgi:hypothetical protein
MSAIGVPEHLPDDIYASELLGWQMDSDFKLDLLGVFARLLEGSR